MKDWAELADEYRDLELRHKEYREVGHHTQQFYQAKDMYPILRPWKNAWPCKRSAQAE